MRERLQVVYEAAETAVGGSRGDTVNIEKHFNSMHLKEDVASGQLPTGEARGVNRHSVGPMDTRHLQHEWLELQQQQQWQQQILMAQFKRSQDQMLKQHQRQQQEFLLSQQLHREKVLEQQRQEQQQQQIEQQKQVQQLQQQQQQKQQLQQLLAKKDKPSATPSEEVKEKLQKFLLNKKQRAEMQASGLNHSPPQTFRHWTPPGSLDHHSPPHMSPQYHQPQFGLFDSSNLHPLRKTASDSNLKVRSRLKEKVAERRSHGSPLLPRRRDVMAGLQKRKPLNGQLDTSPSSSTPGSGPSSPLSGNAPCPDGSNGLAAAAAVPEEYGGYPMLMNRMYSQSTSDLNLYTSPSLPNISLGLPSSGQHSPQMAGSKTGLGGEALRLSNPLPPGAVITPAFIPAVPAGAIGAAGIPSGMMGGVPLHDGSPPTLANTPIAQRLIRRPLHRPLARTQSAPLPNSQRGQPPSSMHPQQLLLQQQHQQFMQHQQHQQQMIALQQQRQIQESGVGETSPVEPENLSPRSKSSSPHLRDITEIKQEPIEIEEEDEEEAERQTLLQEQEELLRQQSLGRLRLTEQEVQAGHRSLTRTQSSPASSTLPLGIPPAEHLPTKHRFTTGLAYDTVMLKHQCNACGDNANHPEHPGRLQSIWARLQETQIVNRCERVRTRKATLEELQSCHSEGYVLFYGTSQPNRSKIDTRKLACIPKLNFTWLHCGGLGVDTDTIWNDLHSPSAARMATGSVIELAFKVAAGELKNGLAIVRPPGHHAESSQAMGFCFFNSVAIAAKQLRLKLKLNKILIIDWDVHHGNSTQKIFYEDPHVLYMSMHRHDNGNFFPGTGAPDECGCGTGLGYNVNVAWHGALEPPMGDTEYLAAFRSIILPIAREFSPDVVLVSAGFDAADGHANPLGGYKVTPACFGYMTKKLMGLAGGRVVLALEGGYDLPAICDGAEVCAQVLLGDEGPPITKKALTDTPNENAIECLQQTIRIQSEYWTSVRTMTQLVSCSAEEALKREKEEADTVTALASLSMRHVELPGEEQAESSEPMEEEAAPSSS
ncbi:histone deacetylase 4-like isoform X3 [Amphiura filiformis]|uniref:histone deacetylase 4-like isoform X3 n=1 Tax=Amphiura filiformis TaxID=82378 RepID=UPI003B220B67